MRGHVDSFRGTLLWFSEAKHVCRRGSTYACMKPALFVYSLVFVEAFATSRF